MSVSTSANAVPVELRRLTEEASVDAAASKERGSGIQITWSDGEVSTIDSETLRKNCPCATCREKRGDGSHQKPLGGGRALLNVVSATAEQETDLQQLWPVGNYAIGMRWSDDHDSGIYHFALLRRLSQAESQS